MKPTWLQAGSPLGTAKNSVVQVSIYYFLTRPEYGCLIYLKSHFSTVPLMALTATATPALQDQLLTLLRNPISSINKSNISFHVMELTKLPKQGIVQIAKHDNSQL